MSRTLALLMAPLGITTLTAFAHVYPFAPLLTNRLPGRLFLAYVPALTIGAMMGLERLWTMRSAWGQRIALALWVAVAGQIATAAVLNFPAPRSASRIAPAPFNLVHRREDLRPAFAYLAAHRRDGDILFAHWHAAPGARFYGAGETGNLIIPRSPHPAEDYAPDLAALSGRVRVVASRLASDQADALMMLADRYGTRIDTFETRDILLHLYLFPKA